MPGWVPRGVDPSAREVLFDGVPQHLRGSLYAWMKPLLCRRSTSSMYWFYKEDVLREFDLVARGPQALYAVTGSTWPGGLVHIRDEQLLDLADWLAHRAANTDVRELERILASASSAWKVDIRNGNTGLVRRVPLSVDTAAHTAMRLGSAGELLGEAWAACFGRTENPEEAYEKAIKAVEEAAAPVVSPKNPRATLGTMVRDMKNQGDWKIDLPGVQQDVAVSMMEALWTGQESRHGGNDYRVPTQSEAEVAVLLAVPLVQWFGTGAVTREP